MKIMTIMNREDGNEMIVNRDGNEDYDDNE